MGDFISDLKNDILTSMPDISEDWAEYCAIMPLSTILHNAKIIEKERTMNLNLFVINIGPSGIKKSLPMTSFTIPIIRKVGDNVMRDFILPSRSSVPGFIKYVNEGGKEDENGEVIQLRDAGILARDEFSGFFSGARKQDWLSDWMEYLSEMYDGIFQKRVTTTHGLHFIEDFYGTLITCTTYYFINQMDDEFFTQGTGNRFLYNLFGAEDYEVKKVDPVDYFSESWATKREDALDSYSKRLSSLYEKEIEKIYVDYNDAGTLWSDYKEQCELEWKQKAMDDPLGWDYYPIKRYAEFALKLSGIYAVSENIDKIISCPSSAWDHSVMIELRHMEKGIALVEKNRLNFEKIAEIKRKYIPKDKPKSNIDKIKAMLGVLVDEGGTLATNDWIDKTDIVGNRNEKVELKRHCISKGWVKTIGFSEATQEQRNKHRMTNSTILCKYIKGL